MMSKKKILQARFVSTRKKSRCGLTLHTLQLIQERYIVSQKLSVLQMHPSDPSPLTWVGMAPNQVTNIHQNLEAVQMLQRQLEQSGRTMLGLSDHR